MRSVHGLLSQFLSQILFKFNPNSFVLQMTIFQLQSHKSTTSANYSHSKWSFSQMRSVHGLLSQFLSQILFKFNPNSFVLQMTIFQLQSHKSTTSANYSHSKWSFSQMRSVHVILSHFLSYILSNFCLSFFLFQMIIFNFKAINSQLQPIIHTQNDRFHKWGLSTWFYFNKHNFN